MSVLTILHIAGGLTALIAGTAAVVARKGGRVHGLAGTWFFGSMLVLGISASILAQADPDVGMRLGGLLTCYFVTTSWVAARRRDGTTGKFEIAACALALGGSALLVRTAITATAPPTPVGTGPVYALAGICLLAGLLDLNAILRTRLKPAQRIARHLWRMCVGFFVATGSFFLGQQDVMPQAVRGSPILFVLAFAPVAVMLFWLVRIRFAKMMGRLSLRTPVTLPKAAGAQSAVPAGAEG